MNNRMRLPVRFVAAALLLGLIACGIPRVGEAGNRHVISGDLSAFSNPVRYHYPVPAAGKAVDTSHPNVVIGHGTPASCTSTAVVSAIRMGGLIRFNCGRSPVTIHMNQTAKVSNTERLVVLDGGGLVTLDGGGGRRILFSDTCSGIRSSANCINQPYPQIVVQNITFANGSAGTPQATCTENKPQCWYGGVSGGGAIYIEGGQFKAVSSSFINNRCYGYGPDLGGGAIRVLAQYENRPVYITGDKFIGGSCSNGGALSSIDVQWDVINSAFIDNTATGWGGNPAKAGTLGGGNGGAIYNDGRNFNTSVTGTLMENNSAREGGGAIFYVVDSGWGMLAIAGSLLRHNRSGQFQTIIGIFDNSDHRDRKPWMINSVDD